MRLPISNTMTNENVLIVDDDESVRWVLKKSLEKEGLGTVLARDAAEAFEGLKDGDIAVVLMDIRMPGMSGLEALEKIQGEGRAVSVIIMTAQATMQNAIEPCGGGLRLHNQALRPRRGERPGAQGHRGEASQSRGDRPPRRGPGKIRRRACGQHPSMQEIYKTIGRVAESDATVLIHGESGTGKELVARAIHYHSKRAGRPFVAVNSAAIPSELRKASSSGMRRGHSPAPSAARSESSRPRQGARSFSMRSAT